MQLLLMVLFVAAENFDENWLLNIAYDLLVSPVGILTLVVFGMSFRLNQTLESAELPTTRDGTGAR
jgi:hypothetical protein